MPSTEEIAAIVRQQNERDFRITTPFEDLEVLIVPYVPDRVNRARAHVVYRATRAGRDSRVYQLGLLSVTQQNTWRSTGEAGHTGPLSEMDPANVPVLARATEANCEVLALYGIVNDPTASYIEVLFADGRTIQAKPDSTGLFLVRTARESRAVEVRLRNASSRLIAQERTIGRSSACPDASS